MLVLASGNSGSISPFIVDQFNSLKNKGLDMEYFLIKGKGIKGYINSYFSLLKIIRSFKPDLVHAHYGLSGLLASIQRKVPVVVTFHGSDINIPKVRRFSRIANKLCASSIFVSHDLADEIEVKNPIVIPCGVDMDIFFPMERGKLRTKFHLDPHKNYFLFSSGFDNKVKNYPLAKDALEMVSDSNTVLLELKGYNRNEVSELMNAVDGVLMTSFTEGSPQFIKEAMACNTPIVSVNVGDVVDIIEGTKGCYIAKNNPSDLSLSIKKVLEFDGRTDGRNKIGHLDNKKISERIINLYYSVLH